MRRFALAMGLALALAAAGAPADAADTTAGTTPPPYQADLLRLSEILGSIQFLRELCGTSEGALWRDQAQALIDSLQPTDQERARLVDRFNRGYESYRSVYRVCTDSARMAVDRYLEEGARIAADIAARYGK